MDCNDLSIKRRGLFAPERTEDVEMTAMVSKESDSSSKMAG